jgi:NAD(P)-dependent dehydrogenase (short-subunit alcohol dehydrogenase family)
VNVASRFVDLREKVVVVTGGSGVLGSEMCRALAAAGARVAVLGRDPMKVERLAAELRDFGEGALGVACNVLDRVALASAAERISAVLGPCDILVNGAGGNHPQAATSQEAFDPEAEPNAKQPGFFEIDLEGFEFVVDVNLLGTLLPTQVFAKQMLPRIGCSVINISSMSALKPLTKVVAYSAAKAAVTNLTQWLAVHFAQAGVRVNAIAPGFFLTEQNRKLMLLEDGSLTPRATKVIAHTPMRRFGEPAELLGTLLWLCEPRLSGFVTGAVIPVDGGFSAFSGV